MIARLFSEWILPMNLSGAAVALALLLLEPVTRKRFGNRWHYYSWAVALVLFTVPFSLPIPIPAPPAAVLPRTVAVLPARVGAAATDSTSVFLAAISWRELIVAVWLGVAAMLLVRQAWAAVRFWHALRRSSAPVTEDAALALFEECREKLRLRRKIPLYTCGLIGSPMLVGVLRPRILLPDVKIDPAELRLVFLHELTHFRHGDLLYKLAALAVCIVNWFNPLAWLAMRRINTLCELACDERLVRGMDSAARRGYGMAILNVMGETRMIPPISTAFSLQKETLKRRLTLIMECKKSTKLIVAAGVCSVVLLCFVGMTISTWVLGGNAAEAAAPTRRLAPAPSTLVENLSKSVVIDREKDILCLTIPAETPASYQWVILAAGRAKMGDGEMSLHWFESRSADGGWAVGKSYSEPLGGEGVLECTVAFSLMDKDGKLLAGDQITWTAADSESEQSNAAEVTLIGGADGPTGIFVASKIDTLLWPSASCFEIAAGFGEYKGHTGIDIVGKNAAGTDLLAAADGTVLESGWDGGYGNRVLIDHGGGVQTLYGHCGELVVKAGELVTAGQRIAVIGSSGNVTGPACHFEVRVNGEPVDPRPGS